MTLEESLLFSGLYHLVCKKIKWDYISMSLKFPQDDKISKFHRDYEKENGFCGEINKGNAAVSKKVVSFLSVLSPFIC